MAGIEVPTLGVHYGVAMNILPQPPRPCAPSSLTRREHEIVGWIAEGKSNRDVAGLLGISLRTVEKHMENILKKMGTDNRTAAVLTWVREHGPQGGER